MMFCAKLLQLCPTVCHPTVLTLKSFSDLLLFPLKPTNLPGSLLKCSDWSSYISQLPREDRMSRLTGNIWLVKQKLDPML